MGHTSTFLQVIHHFLFLWFFHGISPKKSTVPPQQIVPPGHPSAWHRPRPGPETPQKNVTPGTPVLVNSHITMERSTIFYGKIHYKCAMFNSYFDITRCLFLLMGTSRRIPKKWIQMVETGGRSVQKIISTYSDLRCSCILYLCTILSVLLDMSMAFLGLPCQPHKKSLYIIRKAMLSRSFQYPLVNSHITTENPPIFHGKTHDFNGHFQCRKLLVITRG